MLVKREAYKNINAGQMAWVRSTTNPWDSRTVRYCFKIKSETGN